MKLEEVMKLYKEDQEKYFSENISESQEKPNEGKLNTGKVSLTSSKRSEKAQPSEDMDWETLKKLFNEGIQ